jgi:hypothetical protein
MFRSKFRTAVLLLVLVVLALSATAALADGPPYPAVVSVSTEPEIPCTLIAADGTAFITGGEVKVRVVTASPKSGVVNFSCEAPQPALFDLPESAVVFSHENFGGQCSVGPGMLTDNWHNIVRPDGTVKMVCHYSE